MLRQIILLLREGIQTPNEHMRRCSILFFKVIIVQIVDIIANRNVVVVVIAATLL